MLGAIGCLVVVGIVLGILAVVATAGLILIPIAICALGWTWYHWTRPAFKAGRLIRKARRVPRDQAVPLLHEAILIDPSGKATLKACGDWFFAQRCWLDACEAYGDYLHQASDWDADANYAKSLLNAGHLDEAIARLDHFRTIPMITDESRATMISALAMAWAIKGDVPQARAVVDTAGLQKRVPGHRTSAMPCHAGCL